MLLTFAPAHHHHITTASESFSIWFDAYHLLTKISCWKLAWVLFHSESFAWRVFWSYSQTRKTCIWWQESNTADAAPNAVSTAENLAAAGSVVDSTMLHDVEPMFTRNLAELLDGLGVFSCWDRSLDQNRSERLCCHFWSWQSILNKLVQSLHRLLFALLAYWFAHRAT